MQQPQGYNQTSAFDDDDLEGTNQSHYNDYGDEADLKGKGISSRLTNEVYPDPVAETLLNYYKGLSLDKNDTLRTGLLLAPLGLIALFYLLISQSTSSVISFTAFVFSVVFLAISMWMLCDILIKDLGPRGM